MYEEEKRRISRKLFERRAYDLLKEKKCFLAGGAITSLFSGGEINDLDIYCRNSSDALEIVFALQNCYYNLTYADEKSVVLSYNSKRECPPINMITFKYFNSLEEVFSTYDFTVCMGGFDFETEEFSFDERFWKDNLSRRLYYSCGSDYPLSASTRRLNKYQAKGYTISDKELLKMILDCFKLDLSTMENLKQQVSGMYGTGIEELLPEGTEYSIAAVVKALDDSKEIPISYEAFPKFKQTNLTKTFKDDLELAMLKGDFVYVTKDGKIINHNKVQSDAHLEEMTDEEEASIPKIKFPIKAYKYVKRDGDKLVSFWDKDYEYKVGKIHTPKGNAVEGGLWGYLENQSDSMKYATRPKAARIEMLIEDEKDIQSIDSTSCIFKKVKVISVEEPKEVPNVSIDPMGVYNDF